MDLHALRQQDRKISISTQLTIRFVQVNHDDEFVFLEFIRNFLDNIG